MADETLSTPPAAKERKTWHPSIIIAKIAEIILAIFIIGLTVDPLNSYHKIYNRPQRIDDIVITFFTVAGYLLINTLFLIGHLMGDRIPKRTLIMFSTVGCIFHIVTASFLVHKWRKVMGSYIDFQNNAIHSSKQYNDMTISAAVFTFINAAVFGADAFLLVKYS